MPAIASHNAGTSDAAWDAGANVKALPGDATAATYRAMYAWRDPDGDPDTQAAYKFPHHMVANGRPGAASTHGCSAGIAVLNGGRGGSAIPGGDRKGVWNHLAAHLRDADLEPPSLRSQDPDPTSHGRHAMKAPKNNVCRAAPFELRSEDTGDGFTLEGYGAVFGNPVRIDSWEGLFDEVISRGAFAKTISERKPVLQFDHGRDAATGSVPIGAVEVLREDRHGLFVRARMHDNGRVEPIRQAIASGAIDGMSFRFRVIREEWDESEDRDVPLRTINEVELFELGPVVFPAYEATTVGVRSLLADLPDDERQRFIADLRAEIAVPADAGQEATSAEHDPDAGQEATSGMSPGLRREVLFPFLRKDTAA
jgi:hypothetical protein